MSLPAYAKDRDAVLKHASDDVKWRNGKPNYDKTDALFDKYKTRIHKEGSLADIVQNIVKNWEKEVSHKIDPDQWSTVDLDNYRLSCNGRGKCTAMEMSTKGKHNALLGDTMYYNSSKISSEDSHEAFRKTFGNGFAWEVLEVFSGPPNVTFTWRHFGKMTYEFKSTGLSGVPYTVKPTNKMIELFGMCKAKVNNQLQVQDLQVFYDPNQLFVQLLESCPHAPFASAQSKSSSKVRQRERSHTSRHSSRGKRPEPLSTDKRSEPSHSSKLSLTDKRSESSHTSKPLSMDKRSEPSHSSKLSLTDKRSESSHTSKPSLTDKRAEQSKSSRVRESHDQTEKHSSSNRPERHELPPLLLPPKILQSDQQWQSTRPHPPIQPHQQWQSSQVPIPIQSHQSWQAYQPTSAAYQYPSTQSYQGWQVPPHTVAFYQFTPSQTNQGSWQPYPSTQPSVPSHPYAPIQTTLQPNDYYNRYHYHHHHHHHNQGRS